mmetsp:Transcript_106817/g.244641  ORF Transcript_106817/g.244641 Transcript_106817/m.244641 type:complete len:227 (+) Transcript_106817:44-724(+)
MPISVVKQVLVTEHLDSFLQQLVSNCCLPSAEGELLKLWEAYQALLFNSVECPVGTVRYYLRCRGVVLRPSGALRWPRVLKPAKRAAAPSDGHGPDAGISSEECLQRVVEALREAGGQASVGRVGGQVWSKSDRVQCGRFTEFIAAWPQIFEISGGQLRLLSPNDESRQKGAAYQICAVAKSTFRVASPSWADMTEAEWEEAKAQDTEQTDVDSSSEASADSFELL